MKIRTKIGFALLAFVMVFNISCDKSNDDDKLGTDALELPPYESMAVDFSDFLDDSSNSGKLNSTTAKVGGNWLYPRLVVGIWNTALFTNLAVPVASLAAVIQEPWQIMSQQSLAFALVAGISV